MFGSRACSERFAEALFVEIVAVPYLMLREVITDRFEVQSDDGSESFAILPRASSVSVMLGICCEATGSHDMLKWLH
jgi:hypothetical protein